MHYGDTMIYAYEDGEDKKNIHLTYNANTYLIYKRFFDSDLMGDILKATKTNSPMSKDVLDKIESGEITMDNLDAYTNNVQGSMIDTTFLLQAIIAMIATYESSIGIKHSADEIANTLPASLFLDADFITVFSDFLLFGIKKKKDISERLSSVLVKRK